MPDLNSPILDGDVSGGLHAVSVDAIKGSAVSGTAPNSGQVLTWNGSAWAPATPSTGGGGGANGLTYYLNQATAPDAPTTGLFANVKQLGRVAETGQTLYTTPTLTQNTWVTVAAFVSESTPIDPATSSIPAGIWDFNVWASSTANSNAPTSLRATAYVYKADNSLTELGTSAGQVLGSTLAQASVSVVVAQTAVAQADRIYIVLQAQATGTGHTATLGFGDGTPSHVHTSLPLVGGTGLWKNVAGVLQSPASLLVDADVDVAAGINQSKIAGLTGALAACLTTQQIAGLSTTAPAALATSPVVGLSQFAARGDHRHQLPSLADLGAQAALTTAAPLALSLGGTAAITAEEAKTTLGGVQMVIVRHGTPLVPATAGTLSNASWTFNSAVVTFTSASVTLVPGMSISATGLTGAVIRTVDSATQITMSTVATGGGGPGTINVFNSTRTQFVSSSVVTMDGRTLQIGDIVLLTNQSATAHNGPWIVQAIGTGFTLVRPSWFTGTLPQTMIFSAQQGGNGGSLYTIGSSSGLTGPVSIGIDNLSGTTLLVRGNANANLGGNTYTGIQIFAAGSTTNAPFSFQSGVVLTTPTAHRVEWDGNFMYCTTSGAVRTQQAAFVPVPATITSTGVAGQIAYDGSNLYVCTAANTWRRAALTTF